MINAWQASSVIFVDSPVGTGFSYAKTPGGYLTGDFKQVDHLHQFLIKVYFQRVCVYIYMHMQLLDRSQVLLVEDCCNIRI